MLRWLLAGATDLAVVGEAAWDREAELVIAREHPAIAIIDFGDAPGAGLALLARLTALAPATGMVVTSVEPRTRVAAEAQRLGARGCLARAAGPEQLLEAIHAVADARSFVSPELATSNASPTRPFARRAVALSTREREVLALSTNGRAVDEVASLLAISPHTVETYRRHVMEKLGARNLAELVLASIRLGVTSVDRL